MVLDALAEVLATPEPERVAEADELERVRDVGDVCHHEPHSARFEGAQDRSSTMERPAEAYEQSHLRTGMDQLSDIRAGLTAEDPRGVPVQRVQHLLRSGPIGHRRGFLGQFALHRPDDLSYQGGWVMQVSGRPSGCGGSRRDDGLAGRRT